MKYAKKKSRGLQIPALYAVPFFLVMGVLTVVSFIIPLRPTQSYSEKRNLAQFPEFSLEAVTSGTYFDDINTWFSDTFPGRESWLQLSGAVEELHGWSDVMIHGDIQLGDPIPTVPRPENRTEPPVQETTEPQQPQETTEPPETEPPETIVLQEATAPTTPVEQWGGVDAGEGAEIYLGTAIQVGDSAFTYFGFSEYTSNRYVRILNKFAEAVKDKDVNIIHAPAPTAVGIMVENEYMSKLGCAPQDQVLDYLNGTLAENMVKVDTVRALLPHNDEYIFFRTDHHWTALAAYYVYAQICQDMGYEAAALDSFEQWEQGEFEGSLYYKCQSSKLRLDTCMAYKPQGDISMMIYDSNGYGFDWPLLTDMTNSARNTKYMTFLAGDHALCVITNDSIPDAPNCVMVKDSFGNCFAPFLTQNYHKVYVLDYREYTQMGLTRFVDEYDIQDVILIPNLGATQSENVCGLLEYVLR